MTTDTFHLPEVRRSRPLPWTSRELYGLLSSEVKVPSRGWVPVGGDGTLVVVGPRVVYVRPVV